MRCLTLTVYDAPKHPNVSDKLHGLTVKYMATICPYKDLTCAILTKEKKIF